MNDRLYTLGRRAGQTWRLVRPAIIACVVVLTLFLAVSGANLYLDTFGRPALAGVPK